jgi:hypothetical protein
MNSNGRFWEIGLKVIAAAVVGIAVFVGIDRSTSKKSTNFNGQGNNNQEPEPKNNAWSQPGEQQQHGQNNDNQAPQQEDKRENKDVGEKVVNGLKGMYGTFGKLSQVISSLVDVVGSIGRLFGNDNGYGYPPRQPYYTSNPWGCGCNLGPGLHRVNDYIIQVGPTPGQQYGNNFGYC